jgi:hypothetical protein
VIGALTQPERDEVRRFDPTVGVRENERRRTLGHVDGERPRRGCCRESLCAVLDQDVAEDDVSVPGAAEIAKSLDQLGRRRELLELERARTSAKGLCNAGVHESEHARHRALRPATETQRLEKLGERPLVLWSTLYDDNVGLRVAQRLCGLDERARVGRSNARHDLGARPERKVDDRATRRLFAAMNKSEAKRSSERDARLLDGDPYPWGFGPGRDRHRDAVVVRAAS